MSPPPVVRSGTKLLDTSEAWEAGDWEERSNDTTMFQHMVAGSFAGMAEHVVTFPFDTIKTHVQAANADAAGGAVRVGWASVARELVGLRGTFFLWRGVGVTCFGVVPAHAAMFAAYESVLDAAEASQGSHADASPTRVAAAGIIAGAVSTLFHDSIMVPAETIKQRMQLGYYRGATHAAQRMAATGGGSLFRSLPTTLAMNVPYTSLMMAGNETVRRTLNPSGAFSLPTFLFAGAVSGSLAAALTTPLDVIKTRLQTQGLTRAKTSTGELRGAPKEFVVRYHGFSDAARAVYEAGGARAFFRGVVPRMLQMGPSCALSWCAYETAKNALSSS